MFESRSHKVNFIENLFNNESIGNACRNFSLSARFLLTHQRRKCTHTLRLYFELTLKKKIKLMNYWLQIIMHCNGNGNKIKTSFDFACEFTFSVLPTCGNFHYLAYNFEFIQLFKPPSRHLPRRLLRKQEKGIRAFKEREK